MADPQFAEKAPEAGSTQGIPNAQVQIENLLRSFGEQRYQEYARYRWAEEREWYEIALFWQRRQWLSWNDSSRRWQLAKQNPAKPKPMPVTNHFAKTINANANQLGKVNIVATPQDDEDRNRRAAEFAEKSLDAADLESGFDVLRPLLAKHIVLWGMGITKDVYDLNASAGQTTVQQNTVVSTWMLSCADCGKTSSMQSTDKPPLGSAEGNAQPGDSDVAKGNQQGQSFTDMPKGNTKCPECGSSTTTPYQKKRTVPAGSKVFRKGRLRTEIIPLFECYLPRDCRNPNLATCVVQRYRRRISALQQTYGPRAAGIQAMAPIDVHEIYLEALRALVNYNYQNEQTVDSTTVTELWCDWDDLPQKMQQKLDMYWGDDAETIDTAHNAGIFMIFSGGIMLDWGANQKGGDKPYTFFLWEIDPASCYPKGGGVDLVPLQKRLNRLDSLMELGMMCNGTGKWLWPKTQTSDKPSGSPNEVVEYDPIGEGKNKPEFTPAEPFSQAAFALRQAILSDFQIIGNTLGVQQGIQPPGVKSFRGIAYLGAKAEEQSNSQRTLWEMGNVIRYRKVLKLARQGWDEERKVKIAGYNGKFGMQSLEGADLDGMYELDFVPDSSRPRLISEKQQAVQAGLQAGLIDPTDSATREYLIDLLRLDEVNLTDHLQYLKAERDLEILKGGTLPLESPFQKWDIFLKVFASFTLTEEFEELDVSTRQLILTYTQRMSDMLSQAKGQGAPAGGPPGAAQAAQAIAAMHQQQGGGNPLSAVPGAEAGTAPVEAAAAGQGENVGAQLP
jgi:hypothetical protein